MEVDVRARVLWGDDSEEICADWLKKGAPESDIRDVLAAALRERRHHFRVRGAQDLLMALGAFAVGALAASAYYAQMHAEFRITNRGMAMLMVAMVVGPLAGIALTYRGIRRLTIGGETAEAASDLAEFE
jgi:hypothetical protein